MNVVSDELEKLTDKEKTAELQDIENKMQQTKDAVEDNNQEAEAAWKEIVNSGRYDSSDKNMGETVNTAAVPVDTKAASSLTRTYSKKIGKHYKNGTTIKCTMTSNTYYDKTIGRRLWGNSITYSSKKSAGNGKWTQTKKTSQKIDGGRTYYLQFWGDLKETWTSGIKQYTLTSENWRIWFQTVCPSK